MSLLQFPQRKSTVATVPVEENRRWWSQLRMKGWYNLWWALMMCMQELGETSSFQCQSCLFSSHSRWKTKGNLHKSYFSRGIILFSCSSTTFLWTKNLASWTQGKETFSHLFKIGHSIDKCYRILGFPSDFKFARGSRPQSGAKGVSLANALSTAGFPNYSSSPKKKIANIPTEQFAYFAHLVQLAQVENMRAAGNEIKANVVDCAGNIFSQSYGIFNTC